MMKSPRVALVAAVGLAALVLSGCSPAGSNTDGEPTAGGTVTVATNQAWTGFNPYMPDHGTSIGIAIGNAIYPAAFNVQSDQTAKLNSDLLESAEVVSDNPQTVEYKITEAAKWSDGEPITADDFIYLWEHLNRTNPDYLITNAIGYSQIESVEANGDAKSVKVVFSKPFGDWQSLFSPILPAHHMESLGDDVSAWNTGMVTEAGPSGGPFVVSENRPEEYLTFDRNPEWYGAPANVEKLTLRYFVDDQAAVQALSSGEANFSINLKATRALIGQAQAVSTLETSVVPTSNQQFFNTQFDDPVAGALPVRQAIATAVNPLDVVTKVFGEGSEELLTSHHIYGPTSPHYADNRPAGYGSGDAEAAAEILTKAGYAKGADGIFAKDGEPIVINYMARSEDDVANQVGIVLQDSLKKVGLSVEINPVTSADYFPKLTAADYSVNLGNMPASAFPVSYYASLYPCGAGYNFARYCDEGVDVLYAEANATLDTEAQAKLIQDVDKQLWKDVANIPMFVVPALMVHSKNLSGVDLKLPKEWLLYDAHKWSLNG